MNIRGIQPLAWGTQTITGYVNESTSEDETTGEFLIEDEIGDNVTQITGFGDKTDVSIDVIPKATITDETRPKAGEIFTYGTKKITIISIGKKRMKKDVEKWSIKDNRFPGIDLTES